MQRRRNSGGEEGPPLALQASASPQSFRQTSSSSLSSADTTQADKTLLVVSLRSNTVLILRMSNGHTCARRWRVSSFPNHELAALRQTRKYRTLRRGWVPACSLQVCYKASQHVPNSTTTSPCHLSSFMQCSPHSARPAQSMLRSLSPCTVADASCTPSARRPHGVRVCKAGGADSHSEIACTRSSSHEDGTQKKVILMWMVPYTPRHIVSVTRQSRWQVGRNLRKLLCHMHGHAVSNRTQA